VLKETADEFLGGDSRSLDLISGGFLVLEGDVAVIEGENAIVADGDAEDVRCKIVESCFTTADGLRVNHPLLFPYTFVNLIEQAGFFKGVTEFGAEDDSEGDYVDKEVLP
jgi:hypothetical protein